MENKIEPGTGKTTTLAVAVRALCSLGERVLLLAHGNSAVDVLMGMVGDALAGTDILRNGRVIRYGTPVREEVRSRSDITLDSILEHEFPDLIQEIHECESTRRDITRRIQNLGNRGIAKGAPYHNAAE